MNIIDYIAHESRTFMQLPFSEVDSLVLSSFSYFDFESNPELLPTWESRATIGQIAARRNPDTMTIRTFHAPREEGDGLMNALALSPRFQEVKVGCVRARFSERETLQFFAITFFLPDGSAFLAFRGTDDTIAGWREDFELSFKDFTASQLLAYEYACDIAAMHSGPLRFGGHSKGGTLAEFAALLIEEEAFSRTLGVYDHEGPGFASAPSARIKDVRYNRILRKTIVKHSLIGVLFETRPNIHIVAAKGTGFIQHSPFYWKVQGGSFIFENRLSAIPDFIGSFFNAWARSKSPHERELITKAIFDPFALSGAVTIGDALRVLQKRPLLLLASILRTDAQARSFATRAFLQLPAAARDELRRRLAKHRKKRARQKKKQEQVAKIVKILN